MPRERETDSAPKLTNLDCQVDSCLLRVQGLYFHMSAPIHCSSGIHTGMHPLALSENSGMRPQAASVAVVLGIFLIHKETFPTRMLCVYQGSSVAVPVEGRYLIKTFDSKIRHLFKAICSLSQKAASSS